VFINPPLTPPGRGTDTGIIHIFSCLGRSWLRNYMMYGKKNIIANMMISYIHSPPGRGRGWVCCKKFYIFYYRFTCVFFRICTYRICGVVFVPEILLLPSGYGDH
jgi:hypothetical protein